MLFNTTYRNKDYEKESNDTLGKAFSFIEKIQLGGVGSSRLVIAQLSENLQPPNMQNTVTDYANIELRPKGIIIHFANRLERYSWIIPYYRLVIYQSQTFSIHSSGNFIQFERNKYFSNNKKFLQKMSDLKNTFLNLSNYDGLN
jgi:hypothetical protein